MNRIDGTSARQLSFLDEEPTPAVPRPKPAQAGRSLRLLRRDIYAELARRRRRAQIAARHLLEK